MEYNCSGLYVFTVVAALILCPVEGVIPSVHCLRIWYTEQEWLSTHPPSLGHLAPGNVLGIYFFWGLVSCHAEAANNGLPCVHGAAAETPEIQAKKTSRWEGSSPSLPGCLSQATATRAGPASVRKMLVSHSHSMNWGRAEGLVGRLGSAMSIQVGSEHPIPSEDHGGGLTRTLLPVTDSLSFVTLPCPVMHPTPSPVTLPVLALGCISGFCHCVSITLIGVTHCSAC